MNMNEGELEGKTEIEYRLWFDKLYGPEFEQGTLDPIKGTMKPIKDWSDEKIQASAGNIGKFSTPSLEELRNLPVICGGDCTFRKTLKEIDIMQIIAANPGATIQVASQFNCLEMVNFRVTPAQGVTRYYADRTQGPFCSIACGAGTVHRNYTHNRGSDNEEGQVHNASGLQDALKTEFDVEPLFKVQNGYTMNSKEIDGKLLMLLQNIVDNNVGREKLLGKLKVGFHENVGVTYRRLSNGKLLYVPPGITVSQVFCSAMSFQGVAEERKKQWELLAKIILDATYEATLYAAYQTYIRTGNKKVFLTLVGGGVFENEAEWIYSAINRAVDIAIRRKLGLDIIIVDYAGTWKLEKFNGCRELTQDEHDALIVFPPALPSDASSASAASSVPRPAPTTASAASSVSRPAPTTVPLRIGSPSVAATPRAFGSIPSANTYKIYIDGQWRDLYHAWRKVFKMYEEQEAREIKRFEYGNGTGFEEPQFILERKSNLHYKPIELTNTDDFTPGSIVVNTNNIKILRKGAMVWENATELEKKEFLKYLSNEHSAIQYSRQDDRLFIDGGYISDCPFITKQPVLASAASSRPAPAAEVSASPAIISSVPRPAPTTASVASSVSRPAPSRFGPPIIASTVSSQPSTKTFNEQIDIKSFIPLGLPEVDARVVREIEFMGVTTNDAILHYTNQGLKTVALSFANHQLVGGKWFETIYAQEESLIHTSKNLDLFKKLRKFGADGMSPVFRGTEYSGSVAYTDWGLYSDKIVLSDDVEFDGVMENGKIVKFAKSYNSAIITAAAPDYGLVPYASDADVTKLCEEIKYRLKNMISYIYTSPWRKLDKADVIILGAWGCGNFSAKTRTDTYGYKYTKFIAELFADIIYQLPPLYKKICFAIPPISVVDQERYKIFYNAFATHRKKGTSVVRNVGVSIPNIRQILGKAIKIYGNEGIDAILKDAHISKPILKVPTVQNISIPAKPISASAVASVAVPDVASVAVPDADIAKSVSSSVAASVAVPRKVDPIPSANTYKIYIGEPNRGGWFDMKEYQLQAFKAYENGEQFTIKEKVTGSIHNSKEPYFSLRREGNFHYNPIKLHRQVGQPSPVVNTNNIKILRRGAVVWVDASEHEKQEFLKYLSNVRSNVYYSQRDGRLFIGNVYISDCPFITKQQIFLGGGGLVGKVNKYVLNKQNYITLF
jgi:uncharacterized protein (TIGR02452 family)